MPFLFFLLMLLSVQAVASDSTKLYNPRANAEKDVAQLLVKAKAENKRLLLQIGGNWCLMCYRLNAVLQKDSVLKKTLDDNYISYHLNYSPENKNSAYLAKLGTPQRYGFPVLVVLDADGKQLHTQNMALLLKGNGYDHEKLKIFLLKWSPQPSQNTTAHGSQPEPRLF
jgi:thioredoxin-related protein